MVQRTRAYRLGVDVGGTFTDFSLVAADGRRMFSLKVPSTPGDPSVAIVSGLASLLGRCGVAPRDIAYFAHGTTVATNTILQHAGSKVGMLTTQGCRDLLEIGRQKRPSVYDLLADKPRILVPRRLRREVPERMAYDGTVLVPLDEEAVRTEVTRLRDDGVEALAICFLHSYTNPCHEQRAKEIAGEVAPGMYLTASHELTSEFREYERFLTAVINAYVGNRLSAYLQRLSTSLRDAGVRASCHIIQSNGGLMSVKTAVQMPVRTVLSGPSAGVVGAAYEGRRSGIRHLITLDMGGTSTDVALLRNGQPTTDASQRIAGYPLRIPAIAIHTIGAGGGSIAWADDAGGFHVGPASAGAVPGPAAYGLGGDQPTVTDANIVLGRLNRKALLGGEMPVRADLAEKAVASLGRRLGLSVERTALGILEIVVSAMVRAVRVISVEKGEDPRDFCLVAFGGAGPLHATAVARQLGIRKVLVPMAPGLLCSLGALRAVPTMEYARTRLIPADKTDEILSVFCDLAARARRWLASERVPVAQRQIRYLLDMRYAGQNYELTVSLPGRALSAGSVAGAALLFHRQHKRRFGFSSPDDPVQVVSCRVVATGAEANLFSGGMPASRKKPTPAETRQVLFESSRRPLLCPVFFRGDLACGMRLKGPAVIEQTDATTVLSPDDVCAVDRSGNLLIAVGRERGGDEED